MTDKYIELRDQVWRVAGTRVALDSVVYQFQQGRSPEAIQDAFPSLSLSQIYGAIAFYLDHQTEIDTYLVHQEAGEEAFSRDIEKEYPHGAALKARIRQTIPKSAR